MNQNFSAEHIIGDVRNWVQEIERKYRDLLTVEIVGDNASIYRAIFTSKQCMAEVFATIEEPTFAPYKNVYFQALPLMGDSTDFIYTWYDCDADEKFDVIEQLNQGISFILTYQG